MRIQHNIPAMNSYRNYNNNNKKLGRNLEKLSSGYAINRAGDDAAGLAISEKMRAQITGIEVASKNAKDGISVVQTAEGALTEVHDMLNRMFALAEQANNGIYKQEEREKLQSEITQLATEIDRIGDSTNFNGMKLLDGTLADAPLPKLESVDVANTDPGVEGFSFKWSTNATSEVKKTFNDTLKTTAGDIKITTHFIGSSTGDSTRTADGGQLFVTLDGGLSGYRIKGATIAKSDVALTTGNFKGDDPTAYAATSLTARLNSTQIKGGAVTLQITDTEGNDIGTLAFRYGEINASTATGSVVARNSGNWQTNAAGATSVISVKGVDDSNEAVSHAPLGLQIGDSTNAYDKMMISIDSMKSDSLGVDNLDIINKASEAMANVVDAIEAVSVQRGTLGAYQNRLDHTLNNLSVMRENIQDAEATIRDTDMAEEMMKYTKNSILVQSAQAMLAQANQLPQGVLSLLQ